jgi:hypothetical protein
VYKLHFWGSTNRPLEPQIVEQGDYDIDAAKVTLDGILPDLEAALRDHGSEQDVRLKVINRVLVEVCGWGYRQIKTEVANERGFADYALRDANTRTLCVLEAKKVGKLIIDTASTKKLEVQVGGSVLKKAKDGIDQAVGYCVETSCSYAAITDGQSWVFFRLRTDGMPFREGKAIVFPSFASVLEDFATFYEMLAPAAIEQRLHFARISQAEGFQQRVAELVPITDRSIWRLSKSGAFQSYSSRTFFLPTPPAKEILSRRIAFIESKLAGDPKVSGRYFSSKGIRISISNLNAFVQVLEEAFVSDEHLSGLIGRLSNFDIRRMLILAQRTICSPSFRVDDLVSVYVNKANRGFDSKRAMRAMILGDYDRHVDQSSEFIMNVFSTESSRPYSPALLLSVLEVLAGVKNQAGADADAGYVTISSLIDYFEPCRVEPDDIRFAVRLLLIRRLIEPLEPDSEDFSDGAKVGITHSGEAHQELAYGDRVYAEQMAMTTGVRLEAVRTELSIHTSSMGDRQSRDALLKTFFDYILEQDSRKMHLPPAVNYAAQRKLRSELHGRRF